MNHSSKKINWQKPLIVLLIFSLLFGCSEWVLVRKPANQAIREDKPEIIQIELKNGEKFILHDPVVKEDTLWVVINLTTGETLTDDQQKVIRIDTISSPYTYTFSICMDDVKKVLVKQDYTAGIILGVVLGVGLAVAITLVVIEIDEQGGVFM
jgi:hypothetical protein